jgi:RNA polymerase sigma-70 factor (ECF subfamily)
MSPAYDSTSLTLLQRVRSQDEAAWERLVEMYAPLVHYWCRRSDLGREDTADVFQDVFRSVAEKIDSFRRDRPDDSFRGWLRTITTNKIRDHFRRQTGKAEAQGGTAAQMKIQAVAEQLPDESDPGEEDVVKQQLHKALDWIRGDFEEATWQAFWKLQVEEQPSDLVAQQLGMTSAAVRKCKYRVLRRLREELEGLVD